MIRRAVLAGAVAGLLWGAPALAQTFPRFSAPVVDQAKVVPDDVERRVNAELEAYQDRSGNQVAVAVIETTGDEPLEDYTIDLAREWGVGAAGEDNGVLLLIAVEDRRLRIEVGRGVEGELTDIESGRINRDRIAPHLREGDYGEAVAVGTEAIRFALGDDQAASPPPVVDDDDSGSGGVPSFGFLIPLLLFGGLSLFGRGARRRGFGGLAGPIIWGGILGGLGRGGSGSGSGGFGGGFGGGGGGDFGGGGASGDW